MTTIAPQQMMILSAARSISRDVPGRYPSMVDQTNRQRQTKPHHLPGSSNQSILAIDTTKTPTVIRFQKKSWITADDDPLCCEIDFS
jgi:hypothetical protein